MAKSQNGLTEIQIFKRIKEGRGQGSGTTYKLNSHRFCRHLKVR